MSSWLSHRHLYHRIVAVSSLRCCLHRVITVLLLSDHCGVVFIITSWPCHHCCHVVAAFVIALSQCRLRHVVTMLLLLSHRHCHCRCQCCRCQCCRCHHHCHHVVTVVIVIIASSSSSSSSLPLRHCCCCCRYHVIAVIAINAYSFCQYMNDIVRAYRNQTVDLIGICRLFSQVALSMLSAAAKYFSLQAWVALKIALST